MTNLIKPRSLDTSVKPTTPDWKGEALRALKDDFAPRIAVKILRSTPTGIRFFAVGLKHNTAYPIHQVNDHIGTLIGLRSDRGGFTLPGAENIYDVKKVLEKEGWTGEVYPL